MKSYHYILVLVVLALSKGTDAWGFKEDAEVVSGNNNSPGRSSRPEVTCKASRATCSNFHPDVENAINDQITAEFNASYVYLSMAFHFGRDDIALRGFAKKFRKMSDEERDHAIGLMEYMNKRGGTIELHNIPKPTRDEWGRGVDAVKTALQLEHLVNNKLLDLHWLAGSDDVNDPHLQDFLESEYLAEQVESIKELGDWAKILTRFENSAVGEHIFDQELYDDKR